MLGSTVVSVGKAQLTVATYNIKGLSVDRAQVVRVLRDLDADVVAIQEVPRGAAGRARLESLADEVGLDVAVHGGYPRGGVTTAILTRPEVSARVRTRGYKVLPLDVWRWFSTWRTRFIAPSRRGFCFIDLGEYVVFSVHFGLNASERMVHRNILLNAIKRLGPSRCVVAGDLNEPPAGDSWRALGRPLRDALEGSITDDNAAAFNTFTAARPRRRIDAIFVGDGITVDDAHVERSHAAKTGSDHLPYVVQLS